MLKIYIYIGINAHVKDVTTDNGRRKSENRARIRRIRNYIPMMVATFLVMVETSLVMVEKSVEKSVTDGPTDGRTYLYLTCQR